MSHITFSATASGLVWAPSYLSPYNVVISMLLFCCMVAVYCGFYNRYFHCLKNFPGPFWGSVTDLYLFYHLVAIPTHGLELHQRYGPVVRLAPNLLSFSDPELLPKVYHKRADKPNFYKTWLFGDIPAMFQSLKHNEHAAKKRLISPHCSTKALREFEKNLNERIWELLEVIRTEHVSCGKSIDFAEWTRWFLSDVYDHFTFGTPRGCVKEGRDVDGLIGALQSVYPAAATVAGLPWLLLPFVKMPILGKFLMPNGMERLKSFYDDMLEKHTKSAHFNAPSTFIDGIRTSTSNTTSLTPDEVKAECITFMAATLDGVAAFISPFIDNILQHPTVYTKLMAEIDAYERLGALSSPIVRFDETAAMPYFMACVHETLRLDSPAQTILPRLVSEGGIELDGLWAPEGTEVAASPYIIHRDQRIFGHDAAMFRPERWLEQAEQAQRMEKYGMWWGFGDRECAGKYYAQFEMQKLCCQLFRDFEIRSATPEKRFVFKRWGVGMFWEQYLVFSERGK